MLSLFNNSLNFFYVKSRKGVYSKIDASGLGDEVYDNLRIYSDPNAYLISLISTDSSI